MIFSAAHLKLGRRGLAAAFLLIATLVAALAVVWTTATPAGAQDDPTVPTKPTGLSVTADPGSLSMAAAWNAAEGATSYKVQWRRIKQSFLPADSLTVTDASASFTLSRHGDWLVRVEACNDAGCSLGARKVVSTRPARPSNLSVSTPPGKLELTATWTAAPGATSHVLKWKSPDGSFSAADQVTVTGTTTSTSFTVAERGRWIVRVEGCNDAGCGRGIARQITTKLPEKPPRPANLAVSFSPGNRDMTATWDAAPRATSYLLRWREQNESFESDNQVTITDATTAAFTVPSQGDWLARLEACNESGCGPGAVQKMTTRPGLPSNLSVSPATDSLELKATWGAAEGATSYRLKWKRPGGSFPSDQKATATGATATLAVSGRGTWVVRLEGCNEAGCGRGIAREVSFPNSAPVVNTTAPDYAELGKAQNAPRGILVHRFFRGVFSDPDGDALTYSLTIPEDRADLVDTHGFNLNALHFGIQMDADDDWSHVPNIFETVVTLTATDPYGLSASVEARYTTDKRSGQ